MSEKDESTIKSMLVFPEKDEISDEPEKRRQLESLLHDWKKFMLGSAPVEKSHLIDHFVWDGFYPYYFYQPLKVLYVGREALGLASCDYLDVILPAYRIEKRIGKEENAKHINSAFYHARMLRIAWGVIHGFTEWDDIPTAAEIGDTFATGSGISFAMMNLSKLSNENQKSWAADWAKIGLSVRHSGDFISRQIDLLDPDVVVSMNLGGYIDTIGKLESKTDETHASRYLLRRGERNSVVINTLHFSAVRSHVRNFYNPISSAIQSSIRDGWIEDFRNRSF